jgi:hypothetical protein
VFSANAVGRWNPTTRTLEQVPVRGAWGAWLPDGRRLVVVDGATVRLVDLVSQGVTELATLAPATVTALPAIAIAPSGEAVYVSAQQELGAIWSVDTSD